tara:strand:- start:5062 stop:6078 length:1017 start_codon:yes stop_codon:yes gene_type:complete
MREIYGGSEYDRYGSNLATRLAQEAAGFTRAWQSGEISKDEALRRQQRAYDVIGMIEEVQGDRNRGGPESDFYKINQEIKNLTNFIQPGRNQRDISEYEGPIYDAEQLRQWNAFNQMNVLGAERMNPNDPGYAPINTPWDQLNDQQKSWRANRNRTREASMQNALAGIFDQQDGQFTRTFDFGEFSVSPSAYGNRLFTKPVGPPSIDPQPNPEDMPIYIGGWSTPDGWKNSWEQLEDPAIRQLPDSGPVLNSGTKKAVEGIKKIEQAAPTKIEDKTEPESGSTAKPESTVDRLKKIMAKESTQAPAKTPENTYKQTTFNAQQARERRRDPFTGGRETF